MFKKFLLSIYYHISQIKFYFLSRYHLRFLKSQAWQDSSEYASYLEMQLNRTLTKKDTPLPGRAIAFIDQIAKLADLSQREILCIGARNRSELDYLRQKGAKTVTGIDLFSQDPSILVMDMHRMTFADQQFDMIYASHSLEHAYDFAKVVAEILRVSREGTLAAIEVPVQFETRGADLIDFGNCATLFQYFGTHVSGIIWSNEKDGRVPMNTEGLKHLQVVFTID